jgi:hypothetical protein
MEGAVALPSPRDPATHRGRLGVGRRLGHARARVLDVLGGVLLVAARRQRLAAVRRRHAMQRARADGGVADRGRLGRGRRRGRRRWRRRLGLGRGRGRLGLGGGGRRRRGRGRGRGGRARDAGHLALQLLGDRPLDPCVGHIAVAGGGPGAGKTRRRQPRAARPPRRPLLLRRRLKPLPRPPPPQPPPLPQPPPPAPSHRLEVAHAAKHRGQRAAEPGVVRHVDVLDAVQVKPQRVVGDGALQVLAPQIAAGAGARWWGWGWGRGVQGGLGAREARGLLAGGAAPGALRQRCRPGPRS